MFPELYKVMGNISALLNGLSVRTKDLTFLEIKRFGKEAFLSN